MRMLAPLMTPGRRSRQHWEKDFRGQNPVLHGHCRYQVLLCPFRSTLERVHTPNVKKPFHLCDKLAKKRRPLVEAAQVS